MLLTEGLEDCNAGITAPGDGVVPNDGVVTAAVQHYSRIQVVVHHVVLD